ncbi:alpha/beta fold hydrolase [Brachybacterium sp. GCM10030252]|uniref:alpha/beta fold hydrolase n=1 Tax=Brachybacterium sp. GCM10030252 TaxID=3273380 RepID=UPI00367065D6
MGEPHGGNLTGTRLATDPEVPLSPFRVRGAELACEYSDEGGHPVVQLHGLTSSRARDRLLDLDLGRGQSGTRLLRYDARGHGRSTGCPLPEDYRWSRLAEDLLALVEAYFPGEAVHGVGPSMGCGTLLHAAVREPDRFDGLTLLLPPTAWETRAAQARDYERLAAFVERHGAERLAGAGASLHALPPAAASHPPATPDVAERLLPAAYRGAALSDLPSRQELAGLRLPVSILAWTGDGGHPVSTALSLARVLPRARLRIAERPEQVAAWPEVLREDVGRD